MSVAVLVNIPPTLAVASATTTAAVLLAIIARQGPATLNFEVEWAVGKLTSNSITRLKPIDTERRGHLANRFSKLAEGVRLNVPRFVTFCYRKRVVVAPKEVLRIVEACTRKPLGNLFETTFLDNLSRLWR